MKTKDFIKMLQEADPSGEAYIRMEGGIPFTAELKEGYWDGPFSYIDEEGNYVYSTNGLKVDVHCYSKWDFVEKWSKSYDPKNNKEEEWEFVKSKFKFDLGYVRNNEKIESFLESAREAFDEYYGIEESLYNRALVEMVGNAFEGWTWFQNKDVDLNQVPNMHVYYTWKILDQNGKEMGSNVHQTQCVQISGYWEKTDNNVMPGYYQWIFNKNQNSK
jgi:hypothetical protein